MVLSDTSTSTGLMQDARFWTATNSTSYSDNDLKRNLNRWYHELVTDAILSMDAWDFQGDIATASTVANQQEYTFPTNLLKIKRIEVTYDGSTWVRVLPMDVQDPLTPIGNQADVNNNFSTSNPFYDTHDDSIFLYPIPTSAVSAGLKIWYEKEVTELSAVDDEPALPENFHRLISIGAAYDYSILKGLPVANQLLQNLELGRARLRQFFGTRAQDTRIVFKSKPVNLR